jgi:hypothetical protein
VLSKGCWKNEAEAEARENDVGEKLVGWPPRGNIRRAKSGPEAQLALEGAFTPKVQLYAQDLLLLKGMAYCVASTPDGARPSNEESGAFSCHDPAPKMLGLELWASNSSFTTLKGPADFVL